MKGELTCTHSPTKPNTQSTSYKYADWYWYPQWCKTFGKLYGTLGQGRAREGEWGKSQSERQGKGPKSKWGGREAGKHFEIWTNLEQQCPLFIQSDRDTLAKQISRSTDSIYRQATRVRNCGSWSHTDWFKSQNTWSYTALRSSAPGGASLNQIQTFAAYNSSLLFTKL